QSRPWSSVHLAAFRRAPGTLAAAATPRVPYTPLVLPGCDPLTQVQVLSAGLYRQRSFALTSAGPTTTPPPKSHKFPDVSNHVVAPIRAPGSLPVAGTPSVPYTAAAAGELDPPTQVHSPLAHKVAGRQR